ncbi:cupin domain-containing protein [Streptomyces sp. NPDC048277]|uniref:cupin domain-containing protein n=1 Tax=Streptomyces sp. NPDC048277 TaxID=3155027 RepID=UPI00340A8952
MYKSTVDAEDFQPYGEGDQQAGDVHWIREGVSGIWRVTTGQLPERAPYEFHEQETIQVLEGSVRIVTEDGDDVALKPGDVAYFPQGTKSVWHFEFPFRKFFVHA